MSKEKDGFTFSFVFIILDNHVGLGIQVSHACIVAAFIYILLIFSL
jgi:hypothetical protein